MLIPFGIFAASGGLPLTIEYLVIAGGGGRDIRVGRGFLDLSNVFQFVELDDNGCKAFLEFCMTFVKCNGDCGAVLSLRCEMTGQFEQGVLYFIDTRC